MDRLQLYSPLWNCTYFCICSGVCNSCSATRRPVPHRGWDTPVRVCDNCLMMPHV